MIEFLFLFLIWKITRKYISIKQFNLSSLFAYVLIISTIGMRVMSLSWLTHQNISLTDLRIHLFFMDFYQHDTAFLGQLFSYSLSLFYLILIIDLFHAFYPSFQCNQKNADELRDELDFYVAILPIIFLMSALCLNILFFGDGALSGANQIVLIFSAVFAGFLAWKKGVVFDEILAGIKKNLGDSLEALLILLMIGALSGAWMISGIVPTLIYYGLSFMSPSFFLPAACILCCVVSLASGSSWSTVATIGIALMGIGKSMGFSDGMIAGAIISGAYFGDKISPLSDTTNLAPLMAGTDLFKHIRYMLWTTIPTLIISLVIFAILGFQFQGGGNQDLEGIQGILASHINIHPLLLLTPVIVFVLILYRMPTLPLLFIGILLGVISAFMTQQELLLQLSSQLYPNAKTVLQSSYQVSIQALTAELKLLGSIANPTVQELAMIKLLTSKGMAGMLGTVWLIMCAMCFGGVMEKAGFLNRISQYLLSFVKSDAALVTCTAGSCVFFNISASDQYLAIVVPGRMFKQAYESRKLAPEVLSRTLEDCGTVTSVLIPWNTCGAAQSSVLGISTLSYFPYCFFNLLSPVMTLVMIYFNIKINRLESHPQEQSELS